MKDIRAYTDEQNKEDDFELFNENLNSLITFMGEEKEANNYTGFWWDYYVTFFYELQKAGHGETLGYYISQSVHNKDERAWIREHKSEITEMKDWIDDYCDIAADNDKD